MKRKIMALMIATLLMFSGCTATAPDKEGSNKSKYDDVMASETVADDNSEDTDETEPAETESSDPEETEDPKETTAETTETEEIIPDDIDEEECKKIGELTSEGTIDEIYELVKTCFNVEDISEEDIKNHFDGNDVPAFWEGHVAYINEDLLEYAYDTDYYYKDSDQRTLLDVTYLTEPGSRITLDMTIIEYDSSIDAVNDFLRFVNIQAKGDAIAEVDACQLKCNTETSGEFTFLYNDHIVIIGQIGYDYYDTTPFSEEGLDAIRNFFSSLGLKDPTPYMMGG